MTSCLENSLRRSRDRVLTLEFIAQGSKSSWRLWRWIDGQDWVIQNDVNSTGSCFKDESDCENVFRAIVVRAS